MCLRAGKPIAWAIVRSETTATYEFFLSTVKNAVEEFAATLPEERRLYDVPVGQQFTWQPSCVLVDNSDAEISAIQ